MWDTIAVFASGVLIGGIAFYFVGRRKGFNKGHWIGQKHALQGILPTNLAREATGTINGVNRKISFPAYTKHGTLTLKTPHPDHFFLGENPLHRLPVFAEAIFSPDK